MELSVVKNEEKKLIVELKNETVGFTNLVREELWKDDSVSEAASIKEHPYLSQPKIFVATKRGTPANVLEKAVGRIEKQAEEFKEEFKKALKK